MKRRRGRSIRSAQIEFNANYVDNFTDLALDVDGDGWVDVVQFGYFSSKIVWLKNPGKRGGAWTVNEIDASGPTEFAFLVDLNNDGKAQELLPEFDRAECSAGMVRIAERQVGEAYGERTELRTWDRRGGYQWRRAQRHPHAERVAGSACRCARGGRVEVSRHRLGAAPDRARRAPRRQREAASNSGICTRWTSIRTAAWTS